jgi:hypothetical protein
MWSSDRCALWFGETILKPIEEAFGNQSSDGLELFRSPIIQCSITHQVKVNRLRDMRNIRFKRVDPDDEWYFSYDGVNLNTQRIQVVVPKWRNQYLHLFTCVWNLPLARRHLKQYSGKNFVACSADEFIDYNENQRKELLLFSGIADCMLRTFQK